MCQFFRTKKTGRRENEKPDVVRPQAFHALFKRRGLAGEEDGGEELKVTRLHLLDP